jgi:molybdopterin biosynthesis enzyme
MKAVSCYRELVEMGKASVGNSDYLISVCSRVTRCVCEKVAQNVAQPIFVTKLMRNVSRGKEL